MISPKYFFHEKIDRSGRGSPPRGITFLEILFAIAILSIALLGFFCLFTFSNRGTMDAYQETIAYSIAQEGLEWTTSLGYENLLEAKKGINLPLEEKLRNIGFEGAKDVVPLECADGRPYYYPDDYIQFQRLVEIKPVEDARIVVVTVSVWPQDSSFVRGLMKREKVVLEKIIGADYGE